MNTYLLTYFPADRGHVSWNQYKILATSMFEVHSAGIMLFIDDGF